MADLAVLAAQLIQAEAALHKLRVGKAAAEIREDDRLVKFTPAKLSDLEDYIAQLRASIAEAGGSRPLRHAPIHLSF